MRAILFRMLFAVVVLSMTCAYAQDAKPTPQQLAEMEKLWADFAMVGPEHQAMAGHVGQWKTVTKDYMLDPAKPTVTEGKAEFKLVLGGRFLVQEYHGTSQGKPFEGMGMTGYDRAKKKYVGTWVDNFGTGVMTTEGDYDPATKTMTEHSDMSSPMGTMKVKLVTQYKSDKSMVMTMYMVMPDGKEAKSMEVTYTKA